MRVAILSAMETLSGGSLKPRGFARIGGRSVLQHQLSFALASGCERIVCLSNNLPPELIDLQHFTEKNGAKFQVIRHIRSLSGLVKAADEILVVADGLAFDLDEAEKLIGSGKKILTLPADDAVPSGFERMDRDNAWAGVFLANGSLVEKLADLPSDIDVQSSLLRIALQSGTPTVKVPISALFDHKWVMVSSDEAAGQFESQWLRGVAEPSTFFSPIRACTDRAALAVLRRHSKPLAAARIVEIMSVALLLASVGLAYLIYPVAGLIVVALAAICSRFTSALVSIVSSSAMESPVRKLWFKFRSIVIDILILSMIGVSVAQRHAVGALFAGFVVLGLVRLLEIRSLDIFNAKLVELVTDRALLALGFALAIGLVNITPFLQILACILLLLILLRFNHPKLTQT